VYSRANVVEKISPFVRASAKPRSHEAALGRIPPGSRPFVTILREAGAGGSALAQALAEALAAREPGSHWQSFDRELVEKVAADHGISAPLVESLEEASHTWLDKLLHSGPESDFGVYRRVAETMRALAEVGGAVLVGRGGVFVTRDLPGGIHVRLVAPRDWRIRRLAKARGLSAAEAERVVRETEEHRAAFYRSRWPDKDVAADHFHVTYNMAGVEPGRIVESLLAVVPRREEVLEALHR
jgi:cytidylate kinase